MTDPHQRLPGRPQQLLDRAIWLTPRADRDRYAAEWRHDLAAAEAAGRAPDDVARGAVRMAVRLRGRLLERLLLGGRGPGPAVAAWLAVLAVLVAAGVFGGVVLVVAVLALIALVVLLARAGTPSHWSHWLMVVSLAIGLASAGFAWWAAGAVVDAADALRPAPAAASWGGAAVITLLLAFAGLVVSAVVAANREARTRR